jgi:glycosyltransferase involved in cell wall biosynthesis
MLGTTRRRILVISEDLASPWDEGIKKFAWSAATALDVDHEVRMLNVNRSGVGPTDGIRQVPSSLTFLQSDLRSEIRSFSPDVVLYVPSPSSTVASFLRSASLRRHAPAATHGMVALIPRRHGALVRPMVGSASPDVVFVPSYRSLLHLSDIGVPGQLVPIGVDTDSFRPAAPGEKAELRRRYGVGEDRYTYLHVGHLSPRRNLPALKVLRESGAEVIVVGSTSTPEDRALRGELESYGMRVIREVVPVEELYRLSDCYVFPVIDSEGCVEVPLSVLEAMASGLPVLARPFGGLRDHLPAGEDLRYWDDEETLRLHAGALRANGAVAVRDMQAFSWRSVATGILRALEEMAES